MKKWIIDKTDSAAAQKLAAKCGISPLSAEILASRGICGVEDAAIFFGGGEGTDEMQLYSPFDLPDMQKAADAVNEAVDSGERIMIYGDYDCDGILSTAALYNYLDSIGADVGYFINDRADGYGMNKKNVKKLADEGADMIITVDNGISAVEEARFCAENGIKLVITDHHTPPPELPEAVALVDPHISSPDNTARFRDMCGCGVVLKLIAAMEGGETAVAVEMMSDFAALATIADVMPLTGENRIIVRHGLHFMENTENEGLKALIEAVSVGQNGRRYDFEYSSRTLAFTVVPRINASGRMGSAMDAAELFTTDDPQRAAELAARLCGWNDERKSIESDVLSQIYEAESADPSLTASEVIIVDGSGWHKGVVGLAAGKLCERTGKPVFVISVDENGIGTGSARGPENYSVYEALSMCSDILERFGGHKGAGGFTIKKENIPEMKCRLINAAQGMIFFPTLHADCIMKPEMLTVESISQMRSELEPFGEKNPEPEFLIGPARITRVSAISGGKYTSLSVDIGGNIISFPLWMQYSGFPFAEGDIVNIMASPTIEEYNNKTTVRLNVHDMRRQGVSQAKLLNAESAYSSFRSGKAPDERIIPSMLPAHEDYAALYRAIGSMTPEEYIYKRFCGEINPCRMHIIIDVFEETGLIERKGGILSRLPAEKGSKVDFAQTKTIKRLMRV